MGNPPFVYDSYYPIVPQAAGLFHSDKTIALDHKKLPTLSNFFFQEHMFGLACVASSFVGMPWQNTR